MAGTARRSAIRKLDELSNQGAHLFRALGLKAGDHIAFLIEKPLAFMRSAGRQSAQGCIQRQSAAYLTQDEIAYIARDAARASSSPRRNADQSRGWSPTRHASPCSS